MPNQYENADNVRAHYETTGPEIWNQTEGRVRHFFTGFGTCGTISGTRRYLKEQNPDVRIVAIEPQKGHRLPGLKNLEESKPPGILDRSVIDQDLEQFRQETDRFRQGAVSAAEYRSFRVPRGVYEQREADTYMLRARCPAGAVLPHQLRALASVSRRRQHGPEHHRVL